MCRGKVFSARFLSRFSYQATIFLCIAQSRASCYSAVVSLEKAEEFLRTAQLCEEQGWHNSGASRAYYAMFHAVRAALAHAGITRAWWSHGSLHATFSSELVRHRKVYPFQFVRAITEALELRHTADYSDHWVPARRARKAVGAAAEILRRVKEATGNA